jgi:hypothetical protein
MQQVGLDLILSATDLSGFLACRHLTTLERARVRGRALGLRVAESRRNRNATSDSAELVVH